MGLLIFVEDFFGGGVDLDDEGLAIVCWAISNLPEGDARLALSGLVLSLVEGAEGLDVLTGNR